MKMLKFLLIMMLFGLNFAWAQEAPAPAAGDPQARVGQTEKCGGKDNCMSCVQERPRNIPEDYVYDEATGKWVAPSVQQ